MADLNPKHHAARRTDLRWCALLLAVGFALWWPRLSGPIDLRYDAGVYYLLGSSLAEGKGYRLTSEPGEIEANQYPPALPAFVALHELVLGTTDPEVIAPWLRRSYFLLFELTLVALYALARHFTTPLPAAAVALLSVFYLKTLFLSDMLFAEVPFMLLTAAFFLCAWKGRGAWGFLGAAGCGAAAFLLRSAGVALLAAWVADSLLRRRWGAAALRAAVALAPFLAWQAHVGRVERSDEYQRPAYAYQRAPYLFYNVSYAQNILKLKDPFAPELGPLTRGDVARRVLHNAALMPITLGEILTGGRDFWDWLLKPPPFSSDRTLLEAWADGLSVAVGVMVLAGILRLLILREWLLPLYVGASLGMVCLTPWPGQFARYLIPLLPFVLLTFVRFVEYLRASGSAGRFAVWRRAAWGLGVATLAGGLFQGLVTASHAYHHRRFEGAVYEGTGDRRVSRLFFYGFEWREFDMAVHWLKTHAEPDAVVATSSPHWVYLKTGLKAVMPPYEKDRAAAQGLLDSVPVRYALVDDLGFLPLPAPGNPGPPAALGTSPHRFRLGERLPGADAHLPAKPMTLVPQGRTRGPRPLRTASGPRTGSAPAARPPAEPARPPRAA